MFLISSMEVTSEFTLISTPMIFANSISFWMASSGILKPGIMCLMTPPSVSLFSKIVTFIPLLAKKNAVAKPAGPPPITAVFPS